MGKIYELHLKHYIVHTPQNWSCFICCHIELENRLSQITLSHIWVCDNDKDVTKTFAHNVELI